MIEKRKWERRYWRKIAASDVVIILLAVFGAQYLRFGITAVELHIEPTYKSEYAITYSLTSLLIAVGWLFALNLAGSRNPRIYGVGSTEYKLVVNATILTFGVTAIISYLTKAELGRGYLLIAAPVGLLLLLISRWLWRKRLHRQRKRKLNRYRTLIVGEYHKSRHVAGELTRSHYAGFEVVASISDKEVGGYLIEGVPIVADYSQLIEAIDNLQVDTLVLISNDTLRPQEMRRLGWELERRRIDMIVAAALTDIAGPRIHMRPVANLPLIYIDFPRFEGRKLLTKRLFDIMASSFMLLTLSPVLLVVAILVGVTSNGPIFYNQERIGLNGKPFRMWKFRSMVRNADDQLKSLLDRQGTSEEPLHKVENDPRITPVGKFIRKYSLDELPQLFNVISGSMTLVGPRPQRESEVALYAPHHHRRHLVKPGITGLWQVSGRSDLTWEDSVRLDLYYVENWSLTGDLVLLFRTFRAVIKPEGAR